MIAGATYRFFYLGIRGIDVSFYGVSLIFNLAYAAFINRFPGRDYFLLHFSAFSFQIIPNLELWVSLPCEARVSDLLCFYLFVFYNSL